MSAPAHDPDRCRCLGCVLDGLDREAALLTEALREARRNPTPEVIEAVEWACDGIAQIIEKEPFRADGRARFPKVILRAGPRRVR
jgi:hypothetical protein